MKIITTAFDSQYHYTERKGNNHFGDYVRHNLDAFNTIKVDAFAMDAVYQTGCSFDYGDYNCPSPKLELSADGGTHAALIRINEFSERDFIDEPLDAETIAEFAELCPPCDTLEKMHQLYNALNDNLPQVQDFLDTNTYSDDLNDYSEDEETNVLTPKSMG